jgi:hypothetical protein
MFSSLDLLKNHKIANNASTAEARIEFTQIWKPYFKDNFLCGFEYN